MVVNKKSIVEVTKMFDLCFNTVKNRYRRFRKYGIDGLDDKPGSGRPRMLKLETLDRYMRSYDSPIRPSELKADIKSDLGVDTSAGNVRRWLGSLGYSCKTPNPIYVRS